MVHSFPSYGNCTEAVLDSGQCCDEVNGCESEATSSAGPIPTVALANGVEMPLLGLGMIAHVLQFSNFPVFFLWLSLEHFRCH
ncbi:hypothetical protein ANCCAN_17376 [Ancylostoma caninum]|uniref:Uncharacterized protein n=1 Tax=Ancylostoma caninum TaxID=29170 RepID=A0A368FX21_ANCCA|nr:hypothetical protein ANCCAN_17376 [Ancylostoma caninum]